MKTVGQLVREIGVAEESVKDFVISKRKKVYIKKDREGYYVAFKHRFYRNDTEKLVEQVKTINKVGCSTEEHAWTSAALILMGFDESLSFLEATNTKKV